MAGRVDVRGAHPRRAHAPVSLTQAPLTQAAPHRPQRGLSLARLNAP